MDENRAQAYLHLIQQLLDCPNGDEPQILQTNSELLDGEFLQTCAQVATMIAAQGEENQAGFLRNLASQLGEFLGMRENDHSDAGAPADRLNFLMQLLQTVRDSEGNPQQVYPFLQQNLAQLDLQLAEILTAWATDTFAKVEATQAYNTATDIVNLGNLIQQFPLGSRLVNLEIAIVCYHRALEVRTRDTFPEDWARTQNNLGLAYLYRIRGERADNLEQAIKLYRQALEVYTRDAFPQQWEATQNNLGLAYLYRIRGERADNLEEAIAC